MLPQAIGPVFSLALIQGIGFWNDYMTPMLYLPDFPTLANGLFEYEREMIQGSNIPIYFAGLVMSMIPIMILFAVFQNTIMEKTTMGGLKG
jgi:ABC-type glycerol-3-phosphate transport system permease component